MGRNYSDRANNRQDLNLYLILAVVSFAFLAVFSYYTSPLTTVDNGSDAAFFRLVGRGMTKGYLPYRDFFDMKGPYFFLLQYIGQVIFSGRPGIFLLQWLSLLSSLLIMFQIYREYGLTDRMLFLILIIPILYAASFTFEGGNLTEEFSLPLLFLCLLCSLRFFRRCEQDTPVYHNPIYGGVYGSIFGILAFVRVTNAALICAIVFIITICLVVQKEFINLLHNALAFLFGFMAAVLPMLIFYHSKGLLGEMLKSIFELGSLYMAEKPFAEHIAHLLQGQYAQKNLMLAVPCAVGMISNWGTWREKSLIVLGSVSTFLSIAMGNNYMHYYTMAIPLIFMSELSTALSFKERRAELRSKICIIMIMAMLCAQSIIAAAYLKRAADHLFFQELYQTGQSAREIEKQIPEDEKDSVYSYNINPAWYSYTDLFPCNKYCGWQNHYIKLMPNIECELEAFFRDNPPRWLVLPRQNKPMPMFLDMALTTEYDCVYANDMFVLYNRK